MWFNLSQRELFQNMMHVIIEALMWLQCFIFFLFSFSIFFFFSHVALPSSLYVIEFFVHIIVANLFFIYL